MLHSPTDAEYRFLSELIYEHSRIHLGHDKRELVAARLGRRLRATGQASFKDYCALLKTREAKSELAKLVDVISTNHTFFFREPKHFQFLAQTILPGWRSQLKGQPFRTWCAASSSGEEPYSLAITLAEFSRLHPDFRWNLDSSDICTDVLSKALSGIYPEARAEEIPADLLRRYFQRGTGKWAGHFRAKAELKATMQWHHLNLFQEQYPFTEKFHLISCRNVMIYFDRPSQEELVTRMASLLLPGGYLFIGHSESLTGLRHSLQGIQPAVYRKPPTSRV